MISRSLGAVVALALPLLAAAPALAKDRSAPAVAQAPETWITTDDYPQAALAANVEGVSTVRWDIAADGHVENCTVGTSSGSAELDAAACKLITERGRYTPALDRKGRPARSTAQRRVRWQIPQAIGETTVPYTLRPF